MTYTHGSHTLKAGVDIYRVREYEGERSTFSGTFSFAKDTNNPLDTNWSFANAALGIFDSYTESNARYGANERQATVMAGLTKLGSGRIFSRAWPLGSSR